MADLLRVSTIGTAPNGETWSINPVWAISDFGVAVTPAQAAKVATDVAGIAIPAGVAQMMSTSHRLTECRVEARKVNGELETQGAAVRPSPVSGTGTNAHPFQVAWVISLRTALPGGKGRGRLYVPATGQLIDADTLRPTSPEVTSKIANVKTWLAAMQTAIRLSFPLATLAVWSRTLGETGPAITALNPVTQVQMGDILDTQRRRRDSLVENYQTVTWP